MSQLPAQHSLELSGKVRTVMRGHCGWRQMISAHWPSSPCWRPSPPPSAGSAVSPADPDTSPAHPVSPKPASAQCPLGAEPSECCPTPLSGPPLQVSISTFIFYSPSQWGHSRSQGLSSRSIPSGGMTMGRCLSLSRPPPPHLSFGHCRHHP